MTRSPARPRVNWHRNGERSWGPQEIASGIVRQAADFVFGCIDLVAIERARFGSASEIVELVPEDNLAPFRVSALCVHGWDDGVATHVERLATDRAKDSLCLVFFPTLDAEIIWTADPLKFQPSLQAAVIPVYPADVYALGRGDLSFFELVEFKLFRRFVFRATDPETQFAAGTVRNYRQVLSRTARYASEASSQEQQPGRDSLVEHPLLEEVIATLDRGRACLLIGSSSSGKSVLAGQAAAREVAKGIQVENFNFSRHGFPSGVIQKLASGHYTNDTCFVIDDLQSNPEAGRYLVSVLCVWRRVSLRGKPRILAICWPDFGREVAQWLEDAKPVSVYPEQIRDRLIAAHRATVGGEVAASLSRQFGEDLYLLNLAIIAASETRLAPSIDSLASGIWRERTQGIDPEDAVRAALVASSLGRYDIPSPIGFLLQEAGIQEGTVELLVAKGLLRRVGRAVSLGHRSLAGLINDWLATESRWSALRRATPSASSVSAVVLDYLHASSAGEAIEALRGLQARAGFKPESQLNLRAATVVEVWRTFSAIVGRLEEQQLEDPTWGGGPASAMFAATAFAEIGGGTLTEQSLEFLRSTWELNDGRVSVDVSKLATSDDFAEINIAMKEEDNSSDKYWSEHGRPAESIDIERMHRSWVLGLILCAEAVSGSPRVSLLRLAEAVLREQDSKTGAFYPDRVPWCTSRVLLGLAACGKTYHTSPEVQRCVEWLLRDRKDGGPRVAGIWRSGTGRWNSELEATGMALLALAEAGYNCSDPSIGAAKAFLVAHRSQWAAPGRELDGALSLQAYLEVGGEWEQVANQAQQLSHWARGEAVWQTALLSSKESLDQSCRVAQIASHLVKIGWQAVRSDLPAFLDALAGPILAPPSTVSTAQIPDAQRATSEPIPAIDYLTEALAELRNISLAEATVVGDYRRFDEEVRNDLKDRLSQMRTALTTHTATRENFLIWAAPGSGKTFLVQELARSLGDDAAYFEMNFAKESKDTLLSRCEQIQLEARPCLVLFDEVDARPDERWLYENTFSLLDKALAPGARAVFVLVGSKNVSIGAMIQEIRSRPKGTDLLDRVPESKRFEIPGMRLEDKVVVMASQASAASERRGGRVAEIEKFALYYAIKNEALDTPRQIGELFQSAVSRMSISENRLAYEDLFARGDRRNQEFYAEHLDAAKRLSRHFVRITSA